MLTDWQLFVEISGCGATRNTCLTAHPPCACIVCETACVLLPAAKYASAFYGPFRDALQSAPVAGQTGRYIPPHKKEYQVGVCVVGRGGWWFGCVGAMVWMFGGAIH